MRSHQMTVDAYFAQHQREPLPQEIRSVAVHLVGGLLGSLMVGLFADDAVNELATDGLFLGGGSELLVEQVIAVAAVFVFSFVVSYLIGLLLKALLPKGIRVSDGEEDTGLDLTQHSETGYSLERV